MDCKGIERRAAFLSAILILLTFLALPFRAAAQELGGVITYYGSITADGDDRKLNLPSFVRGEQRFDEMYVIDSRSRILVYTSDLFHLYTLDKKHGIHSPQGLAVDREGNLYVAQSVTREHPERKITVLRACFRWERDITIHGFDDIQSFDLYRLAIDEEGIIYAASRRYPGILVLDQTGRMISMISPDEEGRRVDVNNVTIDDTGKIYVVSEEEGRVYVYDNERRLLYKFGEKGGSSGKLSRPRAVGIDRKTGRMYVADYMRHTITAYDSEGIYLFEFGGLGWGEGWFQHPIDLHVDSEGRILVADFFNQRVQVLNTW